MYGTNLGRPLSSCTNSGVQMGSRFEDAYAANRASPPTFTTGSSCVDLVTLTLSCEDAPSSEVAFNVIVYVAPSDRVELGNVTRNSLLAFACDGARDKCAQRATFSGNTGEIALSTTYIVGGWAKNRRRV